MGSDLADRVLPAIVPQNVGFPVHVLPLPANIPDGARGLAVFLEVDIELAAIHQIESAKSISRPIEVADKGVDAMRLSALLCLFVFMTCVGSAQNTAHWDYYGKTGPLGWGRLDPAYRLCSQGKEQSPIDIRGAKLNKALKPIEFHYMSGSVELENTGNTVVVHVKRGSYIVAEGVRYDLQDIEFHHPGEEAVNGKLTDMDAHLTHKSAEGKLAVLAVRLSEVQADPNAT